MTVDNDRVVVCSRSKAQKFDPTIQPPIEDPYDEGESHSAPWFCISITSPGLPKADLLPGWEGILRLQFDDVEAGSAWDPLTGTELAKPIPFTRVMADDLLDACDSAFRPHLDGMGYVNLLVHCEMGISRSNAIGRVLAKYYDLADYGGAIEFLNIDPSVPGNRLVTEILEQVCAERERGANPPDPDEEVDPLTYQEQREALEEVYQMVTSGIETPNLIHVNVVPFQADNYEPQFGADRGDAPPVDVGDWLD